MMSGTNGTVTVKGCLIFTAVLAVLLITLYALSTEDTYTCSARVDNIEDDFVVLETDNDLVFRTKVKDSSIYSIGEEVKVTITFNGTYENTDDDKILKVKKK